MVFHARDGYTFVNEGSVCGDQNYTLLNPTSMFQFYAFYLVYVRNMTNIDRPSFIAEHSSESEFSSVEKANQFCEFLHTELDKHAPLLCGKS